MKKIIFTALICFVFFSSCNLIGNLDTKRRVAYNVDFNGTTLTDDSTTMISYTDEIGNTQFYDQKAVFRNWQRGGNFSKGDRVSLGINTKKNKGTITLTIICKDCKNADLVNGRVKKIVDLTKIRVGNLDLNLE